MELVRFKTQNAVRENILKRMKELIQVNDYLPTAANEFQNPIFSLFDENSKRILGGFETRWMPDEILEGFMVPGLTVENCEAVLIRALPGVKGDMHMHEHGCSIVTCLAETYGFPSPTTELMFGHYVPQRSKQVVRRVPLVDDGFTFITPYVVHAFHTPPNGTAYALALATPKVKEGDEMFDFVVLNDNEWEER